MPTISGPVPKSGLTVQWKKPKAVSPWASLAPNLTAYEPAWVGVPEIRPVPAPIHKPGGRPVAAQVSDPGPTCDSCRLVACPAVAIWSAGRVTSNGAPLGVA